MSHSLELYKTLDTLEPLSTLAIQHGSHKGSGENYPQELYAITNK